MVYMTRCIIARKIVNLTAPLYLNSVKMTMELCFIQRERCSFAGGDKNVANYTPTFEMHLFSDKKKSKKQNGYTFVRHKNGRNPLSLIEKKGFIHPLQKGY